MPEIIDNQLYLGGVPAVELAKKYGTPLEVMEWDIVEEKIQRWQSAFRNANCGEAPAHIKSFFPIKSHYNIALLQLFREYGFGIDATSVGEVDYSIRHAGFKPEDVIFTGNNVPKKDLEFVRDSGVYPNLESARAIMLYNELAPGSAVSVRIKPGYLGAGHDPGRNTGKWDSKFGILWSEVPEAIERCGQNLKVDGLHTHIGTGVLDYDILIERDRFLFSLYNLIPSARRFNCGGGIKIPYKKGIPEYRYTFDPAQKEADIEAYAGEHLALASKLASDVGNNIEINHENGRWYVAEAGTILGQVTEIKDIPDADTIKKLLERNPALTLRDLGATPYLNKKNVGVDFGWENAPREVLYGEENTPHLLVPVERINRVPNLLCDISGRICESEIDQGTNRTLPKGIKPGDIVAKINYGAYGPSSMPFLLYNMYGQMRQVAVYKGKDFETRKPQSVEDMVRNDIAPDELIKLIGGG